MKYHERKCLDSDQWVTLWVTKTGFFVRFAGNSFHQGQNSIPKTKTHSFSLVFSVLIAKVTWQGPKSPLKIPISGYFHELLAICNKSSKFTWKEPIKEARVSSSARGQTCVTLVFLSRRARVAATWLCTKKSLQDQWVWVTLKWSRLEPLNPKMLIGSFQHNPGSK